MFQRPMHRSRTYPRNSDHFLVIRAATSLFGVYKLQYLPWLQIVRAIIDTENVIENKFALHFGTKIPKRKQNING